MLEHVLDLFMMVPAVYTCQCGHVTLGTDPRILARIAEQEFIPFILFHCTSVTRDFARTVISLATEGLSFNAIERFVKSCRLEKITSLQLQLNCIFSSKNLKGNALINTEESLSILYQPYPSSDLIGKCFLRSFTENKPYFFNLL